jgi:hypothetical protein
MNQNNLDQDNISNLTSQQNNLDQDNILNLTSQQNTSQPLTVYKNLIKILNLLILSSLYAKKF